LSTGRVLALDVGGRRLGVAVSDPTRTVAQPLTTIQRGTPEADAGALGRLAAEHGATVLVVGLPLDLRGREAIAAKQVRAYAGELARLLPDVELTFMDERMSTVIADRTLLDQGMRGRERRQVVDRVAATVFLQAWLDRRHHDLRASQGSEATPPDEPEGPSRGGPAETTAP
jgi:putative Holliday junction resolvase